MSEALHRDRVVRTWREGLSLSTAVCAPLLLPTVLPLSLFKGCPPNLLPKQSPTTAAAPAPLHLPLLLASAWGGLGAPCRPVPELPVSSPSPCDELAGPLLLLPPAVPELLSLLLEAVPP